jgi:hypothetical protein
MYIPEREPHGDGARRSTTKWLEVSPDRRRDQKRSKEIDTLFNRLAFFCAALDSGIVRKACLMARGMRTIALANVRSMLVRQQSDTHQRSNIRCSSKVDEQRSITVECTTFRDHQDADGRNVRSDVAVTSP